MLERIPGGDPDSVRFRRGGQMSSLRTMEAEPPVRPRLELFFVLLWALRPALTYRFQEPRLGRDSSSLWSTSQL